MSENDTPVDHENTANSADTHCDSNRRVIQSRRRLLQTITSSGAILLAGCGQNESTDVGKPTGTATKRQGTAPGVPNQTFRVPVDQNPAQISFYKGPEEAFAVTAKKQVSGRLNWILREPGIWVDKFWAGSDSYYTWIDDITITPTAITVTIGDDATWSDGHPITGADIAVSEMARHIRNSFPPYYATEGEGEPALYWDAIDNFVISDKSVTYRSSPGYFEQFWDWMLRASFGDRRRGGSPTPTHIDPYGDYAEAVFETARRAQQGEINPWKGWDNPRVTPDDPHEASLKEKHLAKGGKYVAKFSNPEHVVSNSAWDLVEINGPEAVLEPNSYHRNAEQINYERLILEYSASAKRARAAIKADRLDYAAPGPTPQAVVESLPDNVTQLLIPGGRGTGNELLLNFNHPPMGNRKVRKALMYSLDQSTIAKNIHPSTALPVTTPGGDCWDATDYVSEKWISKNLTTYIQDLDRAASLMKEAGYIRDGGGQWRNDDGEQLTLSLATPTGTPRWEPTVASQLTEFGIHTSVQTLNEQTFSKRVDSGKFPMWPHAGRVTSLSARTLAFWFFVPTDPERFGIYPKDQFETGSFSIDGTPVPRTEERYEVFTIEAPPIGQPNGPLQEYHPSALAMGFINEPPEPEFRRRVKTAMWLANWLLPVIPINKTLEQHFIDDAHWQWPTETPSWQTFTSGGPRFIEGVFASGAIRANPDNREKEAK